MKLDIDKRYMRIEEIWRLMCRLTELETMATNKYNLIVGAIDFGTTFSGWGFSFAQDFKSDPTRVTVKQWRSGTGTLVTEKAPTCVLIRPDGETLEAFGFEAENRYRELVESGQHSHYFYFKRFKMLLYKKLEETLDRNVTIQDNWGKSLPAMRVFSKTIEYLTNDMLTEVNKRLCGIITKDIVHWVITVPAIWTDSAKQFMRESAIAAGIGTDKLTIALEPEAASLYCRNLSLDVSGETTNVSISAFTPGTQYVVLDAGGGTVDVTVHEVEESGCIKEVLRASGGGWGGILVNEAFTGLLIDIVGKKIYKKFMKEETEDWLDLWRDFEVKKKTINPPMDRRINMKFPVSLARLYEKITRNTIDDAIAKSQYSTSVEFGGDKIKIEANVMKSLFDKSVQVTIGHLESIMKEDSIRDVKAILMVGGFSDSPMLQHAVRSAFPGITPIIPTDAVSTIIKGAVIFGHSPKAITSRVLKYTYGIKSSIPFVEGVHPEGRRILTDSGFKCKGIFSKHVEKDQSVIVDQSLKNCCYVPAYRHQRSIHLPIYASKLKNPTYVDQECTKIGELCVKLPDSDASLENEVWVSFTFGGTEITVKGNNKEAGTTTTATVDFLG